MGIYTKSGDTGFASTMTRKSIPKDSPIFKLLGSLDELSSHLGVAKRRLPGDMRMIVENLQNDIIAFSGEIAGAGAFATPQKVSGLESAIDSIMSSIPEVKFFVLPGESEAGAHLDVARTVARRAEREAVSLKQVGGTSKDALCWLNRLSDMIFALARMADALLSQEEPIMSEALSKQTEVATPIVADTSNFFEKATVVCREVIHYARSKGMSAVAAICDNGGNLVCLNRDDNSYIASIDVAMNKAFTSMSLKMTTAQVGKLAAEGETLHGVQYTNQGRIVIFGGGIPLYDHGILVGAIGVSGGTSEQDVELATHGVQVFDNIKKS